MSATASQSTRSETRDDMSGVVAWIAARQPMARHLPGVNFHRDVEPPVDESDRREARVLLTDAELLVLAALEDLLVEKGYAPTLREIAERVGWISTGSISQYLDRLRSRGVIEGRGRSLRLGENPESKRS